MLKEYYRGRGWDENGVPTPKKLADLGLANLAMEELVMVDERIYEMFREIGRDLYTSNMISSHGGNLSIRLGDRLIIKRRGAMLGNLKTA